MCHPLETTFNYSLTLLTLLRKCSERKDEFAPLCLGASMQFAKGIDKQIGANFLNQQSP